MNKQEDFIKSYYSAFHSLFSVSEEDLIKLYQEDYYPGYPETPGGSAWESELKALYCAIRLARPKKVLEIGNWKGHSANHILLAMERNGTGEVTLVDISEQLLYDKLHSQKFGRYVIDSLLFLKNPGLDFDFIVQDGNHTESYVTQELDYMRTNSIVDFYIWSHDYFVPIRGGVGVKTAWDKRKMHFEQIFMLKDSVSDCGFVLAQYLI